jgi:hypothetical protein
MSSGHRNSGIIGRIEGWQPFEVSGKPCPLRCSQLGMFSADPMRGDGIHEGANVIFVIVADVRVMIDCKVSKPPFG